jgi:hypothetical protein
LASSSDIIGHKLLAIALLPQHPFMMVSTHVLEALIRAQCPSALETARSVAG